MARDSDDGHANCVAFYVVQLKYRAWRAHSHEWGTYNAGAGVAEAAARQSMYSHRGWSYSSSSTTPTTMSAYRRRKLRLPRLPAVGPLPFAVLLVAGVAWYHFGFSGFNVHGMVVDSSTGQPLAGA